MEICWAQEVQVQGAQTLPLIHPLPFDDGLSFAGLFSSMEDDKSLNRKASTNTLSWVDGLALKSEDSGPEASRDLDMNELVNIFTTQDASDLVRNDSGTFSSSDNTNLEHSHLQHHMLGICSSSSSSAPSGQADQRRKKRSATETEVERFEMQPSPKEGAWSLAELRTLYIGITEHGRKWSKLQPLFQDYGSKVDRIKRKAYYVLGERRKRSQFRKSKTAPEWDSASIEKVLRYHKAYGMRIGAIRAKTGALQSEASIELAILMHCDCASCEAWGLRLGQGKNMAQLKHEWAKKKAIELEKLLDLHLTHKNDLDSIRRNMGWNNNWTSREICDRIYKVCGVCDICTLSRADGAADASSGSVVSAASDDDDEDVINFKPKRTRTSDDGCIPETNSSPPV